MPQALINPIGTKPQASVNPIGTMPQYSRASPRPPLFVFFGSRYFTGTVPSLSQGTQPYILIGCQASVIPRFTMVQIHRHFSLFIFGHFWSHVRYVIFNV